MYILLLQDEIFCRHQLSPFDLWCHLGLWFLCLDNLSIGDRGVLKSPTATMLGYICAFKSFSVCLVMLGALTLGAHMWIIVISFWCVVPFISMTSSTHLSHLTNVSLKSTLSDIRIATPACLGGGLFCPTIDWQWGLTNILLFSLGQSQMAVLWSSPS
jgi:hypothetical protein